jgi:hypothetical protein
LTQLFGKIRFSLDTVIRVPPRLIPPEAQVRVKILEVAGGWAPERALAQALVWVKRETWVADQSQLEGDSKEEVSGVIPTMPIGSLGSPK